MSSDVTLRGGLRVSVEALELLLDLERAEYQVSVSSSNGWRVMPRRRLTPDQATAVGRLRLDLVALVRYCDDVDALVSSQQNARPP